MLKASPLIFMTLLLHLCMGASLWDEKVNSDFLDQSYVGTYRATQFTVHENVTQPLFRFLDVSSGNMEVTFVNNQQSIDSRSAINEFYVEMFNPVYHDGKAITIALNLSQLIENTSTWADTNDTKVTSYKKQQPLDTNSCSTTYNITLEGQQGYFTPTSVIVHVNMTSEGEGLCDFRFEADLYYHDYKITAILYCLFVSVVILGQIFSAYKLIKDYTNGQVEANKLSLATVAFCNIQDFFLTMMHLYILMAQEQYYIYFILPIFLLVLLSVVFDMKLLFIVWRAKYMTSFISTSDLRKRLTVFYVKFYLGLFSYLTIMYFFTYEIWSLLIQALLFAPQIVHNARKGNNPFFYPYYIFGVLGMRMILPLYYRGCPVNIYVIEPSLAFCAIWASLFAIQITILFLQHKLGPRFFIPRCLIPGYYNYSFKYKVSEAQEVPDCPICLQPLNSEEINEPISINDAGQSQLSQSLMQVTVMRAPCQHLFHKECLKHWIDVKLECPTCRGVLPPLNN